MKNKTKELVENNMNQIHFYNGNGLNSIPCLDCSKEAFDHIHRRNTGIICDNPDGPCACGAWHRSSQS